MYVFIPTCVFCERVQDNHTVAGQSSWMAVKDYQRKYNLLPEQIWSAHTDCPDCAPQYALLMARHQVGLQPLLAA